MESIGAGQVMAKSIEDALPLRRPRNSPVSGSARSR